MSYIIHRIQKLHTINAAKRHNERQTQEARDAGNWTQGEAIHDRDIKKQYNARKGAVLGIEGIYTATPATIAEWDDNTLRSFFNDCLNWHKKEYGSRVISIAIHLDESTPHMHVISIPEDERGKLCAKNIVGDRKKMQARQSSIAKEVGYKYGLERGRVDSKETHKPVYTAGRAAQAIRDADSALQAAENAQIEAERIKDTNMYLTQGGTER